MNIDDCQRLLRPHIHHHGGGGDNVGGGGGYPVAAPTVIKFRKLTSRFERMMDCCCSENTAATATADKKRKPCEHKVDPYSALDSEPRKRAKHQHEYHQSQYQQQQCDIYTQSIHTSSLLRDHQNNSNSNSNSNVHNLDDWIRESRDNVYVGPYSPAIFGTIRSKWANPFNSQTDYLGWLLKSGRFSQIEELRSCTLGCWCVDANGSDGHMNDCPTPVLLRLFQQSTSSLVGYSPSSMVDTMATTATAATHYC